MTVTLLTVFTKKEASEYLKNTLSEPLREIIDLMQSVEINPEVLDGGEDGSLLAFFPNSREPKQNNFALNP